MLKKSVQQGRSEQLLRGEAGIPLRVNVEPLRPRDARTIAGRAFSASC